MNFQCFLVTCSLLLGPFVFGQPQASNSPSQESNILRSNTASQYLPPIEMNNAFYDASRDFLPYFVVSKSTPVHLIATPVLEVLKTAPVKPPYDKIILDRFGKHLRKTFVAEPSSGISRNERTNGHLIVPFRINSQNQVEELLSYNISWRESAAPAAAERRSRSSSFVTSSVLQSGNWYKIAVTQTGIHKLTKSFLTSLGISASAISGSNIRVFGNGGAMLPELNSAPRVDDLHENPILVVDGNDGSFDNSDYVLFYATGPTEWKKAPSTSALKYQPVKNLYSDTSFYFVTVDYNTGIPQRVQVQPSGTNPTHFTSTYDYYNFHEEDLISLAKSGRQLMGESFEFVPSYTFRWSDGGFVTGDSLLAECGVAAAFVSQTQFAVTGNGLNLNFLASGIPSSDHPDYARYAFTTSGGINTVSQEIALTVERKTPKANAWLDRLTVNARRQLQVGNRQIQFRDRRVSSPGFRTQFSVNSANPQSVQLWNVTDPRSPFIQAYNVTANGFEFVASADSANEYCAAPPVDFYQPVNVGKVTNQNLHGIMQADYLIITHPLFVAEAERLGSFHQDKEGYSYAVVTVDQIYNEFSSGRPDAAAIRDFIRMVYSRNTGSRELQYVCLMGDGSYNNKSRNLVNNSNLIPTYQSISSFSPIESVTSDDFYAMMDPDEGLRATERSTSLVDVGIGRLTCRTVNEVRAILDKIEHYYSKQDNFQVHESIPVSHQSSQSPIGDWRTWLLFLADDGDGALHMKQSDLLASLVKQKSPGYNLDKIMLDAYQRFSTPGGNRFPDAASDFERRMKKGALIFNYTGHGGEVGLTAERLVDVEMINRFDNFNQLPLFITATCEFSRYDDPNRTSAGELSLLNPRGAAIGLMTTCRLAFSSTNLTLNKLLIEKIFSVLPDGRRPALGDIMRLTKRDLTIQDFFYAHFHLLGDPALRLAYPDHQVVTTRVNGVAVSDPGADTLSALGKVTIEGIVTDLAGNKLDYNGVVYPTVLDKEQTTQGLVNYAESAANYGPGCDTCSVPFVFTQQRNILYRGKARVTNGNFSFTFLVPKDISFAIGPGKVTYYATDGLTDAMGHHSDVVVGGEANDAAPDNAGPEINLFINEKNFVSGGLTDDSPILYADLSDSSGINTSGIGLGHDITVVLDQKKDKPVVLNDYYEANLNSYQSGRIRYPFSEVAEGPHNLSFKVWDIQNNSSMMALDFIVAKRADVALKHVLNYPNPFTTRTKFFFEHNQSGVPLKVHIQVYTVSGKLVKTIQQTVVSDSFISDGIDWDGKDDFGDKLARGVYIYRLSILDVGNKKAEKIEKLVILN